MRRLYKLIILFVLILNFCGCRRNGDSTSAKIAVSNSYLHSAVLSITTDDNGVMSLCPPGMCPEHFDISPQQVKSLRNCRLLLRFDFQQGLDSSLAGFKQSGLAIEPVTSGNGLAIPDNYILTCENVAAILSEHEPQKAQFYQNRLNILRQDMAIIAERMKMDIRIHKLENAAVLASYHQAEFCKWLGFDVIAAFPGSDIATVANVQACLEKAKGRQIKFVIANRQEGTAFAEALAERLGAKLAVFDNFPQITAGSGNFKNMLDSNVKQLLADSNE